MRNFRIILNAEHALAREVALAVVVTQPLNGWLYVIPGMFIVDFLRRQSAIRRYSNQYMHLRRQALNNALAAMQGNPPDQIHSGIGFWTATQERNTSKLDKIRVVALDWLTEHYQKCLKAQGKNYRQLLANAYGDRVSLELAFNRLAEIEEQLAQARLVDATAQQTDYHHLAAEQEQVVTRRCKLIDSIF